MMCPGCGMMGGMWWMLFWLVLIVAGIALVVWALVRRPSSRSLNARDTEDAALIALRERFARGEIDELEYQERRRVLEDRPG